MEYFSRKESLELSGIIAGKQFVVYNNPQQKESIMNHSVWMRVRPVWRRSTMEEDDDVVHDIQLGRAGSVQGYHLGDNFLLCLSTIKGGDY